MPELIGPCLLEVVEGKANTRWRAAVQIEKLKTHSRDFVKSGLSTVTAGFTMARDEIGEAFGLEDEDEEVEEDTREPPKGYSRQAQTLVFVFGENDEVTDQCAYI